MKKVAFLILVAVLLLAASMAQADDVPSGSLIVPYHHLGVMGDNDIPVTATYLVPNQQYRITMRVRYHGNPRTPPESGATPPASYEYRVDFWSDADGSDFTHTFTVPLPDCHWQITAGFTLYYSNDGGESWGWNGDEDATQCVDIWFDCPGEGCTPGFWQGKKSGRLLWDEMPDPDFDPANLNPYWIDTLFNDFFDPVSDLDELTMLDLVGKGGGPVPARKAARDVVAAGLSARHAGVDYPYSLQTVMDMWTAAVASGNYAELQASLNNANELGCPID